METEKTCPWDGEKFTPTHNNEIYCSDACYDAAKAERQKRKRDPVRGLILILMNNHERIANVYTEGKTSLTNQELEAYGIDVSLSRHMQPTTEHSGKLMLDFGEYYLITEPNFLTFKICKHGTSTTV